METTKTEVSIRREELRVAIHERDEAERNKADALSALTAARQHLAEAAEHLAGYASIDSEIAEARAGAMKYAIAAGYDLPDLGEIPPELATRKAERDALAEKVKALQGVVASFAGDAANWDATMKRMAYTVQQNAAAIIADEAEAMAEEFETTIARARSLQRDLHAIANVPLVIPNPDATRARGAYSSTVTRPQVSARVLGATGENIAGSSYMRERPGAHDAQIFSWTQHFRELQHDAGATHPSRPAPISAAMLHEDDARL
ncbi:hypothetical protein [Methylosinus sp. Ce-a6]|uniref:hypothetical protein n=1 Tax=Methylosinus sp. Ce-a6 TaxID=2172005 RepID=UPI0013579537|nr:hypothetical protein [Methylosinus sp. Ce-a6]